MKLSLYLIIFFISYASVASDSVEPPNATSLHIKDIGKSPDASHFLAPRREYYDFSLFEPHFFQSLPHFKQTLERAKNSSETIKFWQWDIKRTGPVTHTGDAFRFVVEISDGPKSLQAHVVVKSITGQVLPLNDLNDFENATLNSQGFVILGSFSSVASVRDLDMNSLSQLADLNYKTRLLSHSNPLLVCELFREFARRTHKSFLKLSLQNEYSRQSSRYRTYIDAEGNIHRLDSDIEQVFNSSSGILLLDPSNSSPKYVTAYNQLLDHVRKSNQDHVRIYGVTNHHNDTSSLAPEFPPDFYGRFQLKESLNVESLQNLAFKDPIETIEELNDQSAPIAALDLHTLPFDIAIKKLVGNIAIAVTGQLLPAHGTLLDAIIKDEPIFITGHIWHDPEFIHFVREMLLSRKLRFNGKDYYLGSKFKIYKSTTSPPMPEGIQKHIIPYSHAFQPSDRSWVITESNIRSLLFGGVSLGANGDIRRAESPFFNWSSGNEPYQLHIQSNLPDWVWNELMQFPHPMTVILKSADIKIPFIYEHLISGSINEKSKADVIHEPHQKILPESYVTVIEGINADNIEPYITLPEHHLSFYTQSNISIDSLWGQLQHHGDFNYSFEPSHYLNHIINGGTLIIHAASLTPRQRDQMASLFLEKPYLYINGKRYFFGSDIKGKVMIINRGHPLNTRIKFLFNPQNFSPVKIAERHKPLEAIVEKFNRLKYPDISKVSHLFESKPFSISEDRMSHMFDRYDYLVGSEGKEPAEAALQAINEWVTHHYTDLPKTHAFLGIWARKQIMKEFNIQMITSHQSRSFDAAKVTGILNQLVEPETLRDRIYQIAETMSDDLLGSFTLEDLLAMPNNAATEGIIDLLKEALINPLSYPAGVMHHQNMQSLFQEVVKRPGLPENAPVLRSESSQISNYDRKTEEAYDLLRFHRAIFLQGPPGVGKSYLSKLVSTHLSAGDLRKPVTIGRDQSIESLIGQRVNINGQSIFKPGPIASWLGFDEFGNPPKAFTSEIGSVLVFDEANLANPDFWNFLKPAFQKHDPHLIIDSHKIKLNEFHKIIFTGNENHMEGRNVIDLFQDHVPTVHFSEFDDSFLQQQSLRYLQKRFHAALSPEKATFLSRHILQIFNFYKKIAPAQSFSLRDLQEWIARIELKETESAQLEEIWFQSFSILSGQMDEPQSEALIFLMQDLYQIPFDTHYTLWQNQMFDSEFSAAFEFGDSGKKLILTDSSRSMLHGLDAFFRLRNRRIKTPSTLFGKRGLIFEGPSARGKDEMILKYLELKGYKLALGEDGKILDLPGIPNAKKVYRITGNPDYSNLFQTIQRAKQEGAVVLFSEMNTLDSGLLEGKLNDLLTDEDALPSFAFLCTINSSDYSGREHFSSAFKNRFIYQKQQDYPENELYEIVAGQFKNKVLPPAGYQLLKAHIWLRDYILDTGSIYTPTTRELLDGMQGLIQGKTFQDVFSSGYKAFYLQYIAGLESLPPMEDLLKYTEKHTSSPIQNSLSLAAKALLPKKFNSHEVIEPSVVFAQMNNGGSYHSQTNKIRIKLYDPETLPSDFNHLHETAETFVHEVGHGIFTRTVHFEGSESLIRDSTSIYMDLEDMRQERSMSFFFGTTFSQPEQLFAHSLLAGESHKIQLDSRQTFSYFLRAYAKGYFDHLLIPGLKSDSFEDTLVHLLQTKIIPRQSTHLIPALRLAVPHLKLAREIFNSIPLTLGEIDVLKAQLNSNRLILIIQKDYLTLTEGRKKDEPKTLDESDTLKLMSIVNSVSGTRLRSVQRHISTQPDHPELPSQLTSGNTTTHSATHYFYRLLRYGFSVPVYRFIVFTREFITGYVQRLIFRISRLSVLTDRLKPKKTETVLGLATHRKEGNVIEIYPSEPSETIQKGNIGNLEKMKTVEMNTHSTQDLVLAKLPPLEAVHYLKDQAGMQYGGPETGGSLDLERLVAGDPQAFAYASLVTDMQPQEVIFLPSTVPMQLFNSPLFYHSIRAMLLQGVTFTVYTQDHFYENLTDIRTILNALQLNPSSPAYGLSSSFTVSPKVLKHVLTRSRDLRRRVKIIHSPEEIFEFTTLPMFLNLLNLSPNDWESYSPDSAESVYTPIWERDPLELLDPQPDPLWNPSYYATFKNPVNDVSKINSHISTVKDQIEYNIHLKNKIAIGSDYESFLVNVTVTEPMDEQGSILLFDFIKKFPVKKFFFNQHPGSAFFKLLAQHSLLGVEVISFGRDFFIQSDVTTDFTWLENTSDLFECVLDPPDNFSFEKLNDVFIMNLSHRPQGAYMRVINFKTRVDVTSTILYRDKRHVSIYDKVSNQNDIIFLDRFVPETPGVIEVPESQKPKTSIWPASSLLHSVDGFDSMNHLTQYIDIDINPKLVSEGFNLNTVHFAPFKSGDRYIPKLVINEALTQLELYSLFSLLREIRIQAIELGTHPGPAFIKWITELDNSLVHHLIAGGQNFQNFEFIREFPGLRTLTLTSTLPLQNTDLLSSLGPVIESLKYLNTLEINDIRTPQFVYDYSEFFLARNLNRHGQRGRHIQLSTVNAMGRYLFLSHISRDKKNWVSDVKIFQGHTSVNSSPKTIMPISTRILIQDALSLINHTNATDMGHLITSFSIESSGREDNVIINILHPIQPEDLLKIISWAQDHITSVIDLSITAPLSSDMLKEYYQIIWKVVRSLKITNNALLPLPASSADNHIQLLDFENQTASDHFTLHDLRGVSHLPHLERLKFPSNVRLSSKNINDFMAYARLLFLHPECDHNRLWIRYTNETGEKEEGFFEFDRASKTMDTFQSIRQKDYMAKAGQIEIINKTLQANSNDLHKRIELNLKSNDVVLRFNHFQEYTDREFLISELAALSGEQIHFLISSPLMTLENLGNLLSLPISIQGLHFSHPIYLNGDFSFIATLQPDLSILDMSSIDGINMHSPHQYQFIKDLPRLTHLTLPKSITVTPDFLKQIRAYISDRKINSDGQIFRLDYFSANGRLHSITYIHDGSDVLVFDGIKLAADYLIPAKYPFELLKEINEACKLTGTQFKLRQILRLILRKYLTPTRIKLNQAIETFLSETNPHKGTHRISAHTHLKSA